MTFWRIYEHKCRFKHNVKDAPWLEDRACIDVHEHGFKPNPLCKIIVEVATTKIIDFKLIKKITVNALKVFADKVIEEEIETEMDGIVQPWYYDFGTLTTETIVDDLRKLILAEFRNLDHKDAVVRIRLYETRKYSVYDDGA